jgi:acetylornithine aminotransferase
MLCRESCNVFDPGDHASTFGGNPLACRVGLTVCETLVQENVLANVRDRGEQLQAGLQSLVARYPHLCAAERGWGLLRGLVLPENSPMQARDVVAAAIAEGLLLVPAGTQVVRFVPPLIVTAAEMAEALAALERAIGKLAASHS